jgi:hypothetical protein
MVSARTSAQEATIRNLQSTRIICGQVLLHRHRYNLGIATLLPLQVMSWR